MKLLRYGDEGQEKWGILDGQGQIRTLEDALIHVTGEEMTLDWLAQLQKLEPETLPILKAEHRIGACIPRPRNFVCIGLNYADHAAETGAKAPKEPIVFLKSLSAFCGPYDDVIIPPGSEKTDWEIELGVVIGAKASRVSEAAALDYVAGYAVVNDVSERHWQTERGGSWDKGKGADHFGPVGPWLVTKDEVADPQKLKLFCEVDGRMMQDGTTANMIFGVKTLVSYVSQFITLYPGDIIATGTPAGVGMGQKPNPIFLRPGQSLRLGVEGLGEQRSKTVGG
ncbi:MULTISPECIES: fumarylacetoacetate hydrolase family protein [unclassified Acidocella]|uniref:fumarylacetoacetate hydrolase family protein n=1 Tax=unclassified Acidocella TaxID=2648610 RepID=UPI00028D7354|nr:MULTISPECIES: fumarylacetoacetate hydrolase family protein [unclassified Acidocella]EKM99998.1 fumarylacetoacetate hydrolase family protein [Acidocella sp. MX-AZ02]WBO59585.1 fumarylacetoacetate hydrolase family protein [Acidocella sp. MX-AZ03]